MPPCSQAFQRRDVQVRALSMQIGSDHRVNSQKGQIGQVFCIHTNDRARACAAKLRNHVNNLTAGRATANDVRRFHTKTWPVRPAHTAMVPQQGGMNGLLAVIRSGEGGWESINRGRAGDTPGGRPGLKQMAIGDIMKEQKAGRMFAVGAYQFIPGTLARAMKESGLKPTDKFTPENQNRLAIALIMGSKRPRLAAYLNGTSDDINAAHLELSMEWAAVKGPDGRGYYDGDRAGNMGTINAAKTRQALMLARQYNLQQRQ